MAIEYFSTWTTCCVWLAGDQRGWDEYIDYEKSLHTIDSYIQDA